MAHHKIGGWGVCRNQPIVSLANCKGTVSTAVEPGRRNQSNPLFSQRRPAANGVVSKLGQGSPNRWDLSSSEYLSRRAIENLLLILKCYFPLNKGFRLSKKAACLSCQSSFMKDVGMIFPACRGKGAGKLLRLPIENFDIWVMNRRIFC